MKTGTIMDAVESTKDLREKNEAMETAAANNQIKKLQEIARMYREAHTQKVREYKKTGRNEPCPCGSGKKYKHCCLASGKYEKLVPKK